MREYVFKKNTNVALIVQYEFDNYQKGDIYSEHISIITANKKMRSLGETSEFLTPRYVHNRALMNY